MLDAIWPGFHPATLKYEYSYYSIVLPYHFLFCISHQALDGLVTIGFAFDVSDVLAQLEIDGLSAYDEPLA